MKKFGRMLFGLLIALFVLGKGFNVMATSNQDIDVRNSVAVFGHDPEMLSLAQAVMTDNDVRLQELLDRRPELVNRKGNAEITLLLMATVGQKVNAINSLLRLGADAWASSESRFPPPLVTATLATKGPDMLGVMLKTGVFIEGGPENEEPLIATAILSAPISKLQQLLQAGANPNVADRVQKTPLVFAISSRQYDKAELLLEMGADPRLGRKNLIENLQDWHNNWKPGSEQAIQVQRLIKRMQDMGMTRDTKPQRAPTVADIKASRVKR